MDSFERPQNDFSDAGEVAERPFKRFDREIEMKIYGIHACREVFVQRPQDIIRCYFDQQTAGRFGDIMKFCARQRLAYHLVPSVDLERIAQTTQHEGICMLIRKCPLRTLEEFFRDVAESETALVVAVEDIRNPFTLGAIMRVAAHFGADALLVRDAQSVHTGAAFRHAEGGAEALEILEAPDMISALGRFREAGFQIVSTSVHSGTNLYASKLAPKALFLFGGEAFGLTPEAMEAGDALVRIPGAGYVESLNVASAAAVILGEQWRQVFGATEEAPEEPEASDDLPLPPN